MNVETFAAVRKLSGLTQRQLADRLGVSQQMIGYIETRQRGLSESMQAKMYGEFGRDYIEQVAQLAALTAPAK